MNEKQRELESKDVSIEAKIIPGSINLSSLRNLVLKKNFNEKRRVILQKKKII